MKMIPIGSDLDVCSTAVEILERIGNCGLVGEGLSLGMRYEVLKDPSHFHSLSLSLYCGFVLRQELSSTVPEPCLPNYYHSPGHDGDRL